MSSNIFLQRIPIKVCKIYIFIVLWDIYIFMIKCTYIGALRFFRQHNRMSSGLSWNQMSLWNQKWIRTNVVYVHVYATVHKGNYFRPFHELSLYIHLIHRTHIRPGLEGTHIIHKQLPLTFFRSFLFPSLLN